MATDNSSGTTASATGNPTLDALLADNPDLAAQLQGLAAGGGVTSMQPQSLSELVAGSALDVTSRTGLTGDPYTGKLPSWAKDTLSSLAPSIQQGIKSAMATGAYDPYLGFTGQQGDEAVYFKSATVPATATQHLAEGMSHAAPEKIGWQMDSAGAQSIQDSSGQSATGAPDGGVDFRSGGQHQADQYIETSHKRDRRAHREDSVKTVTQALNMPYLWSEGEINTAMQKMREAGMQVSNFDDLVQAWGSLVQRASATYALSEGKNKVSPWDVLDMYKSEQQAAGTYMNYNNGSKTTVQRSVADVSEGEAWAAQRDVVSRMLGRDPTDQELRDYTYRMNQLAAANPSISKTITHYKNGEAVSSDTKNTQGFSAADMQQAAYEDAQSNPEYGAYQAATTYFNSAMSALGAIGG